MVIATTVPPDFKMEEIPMETIHGNLATLKSVEAIMEETDRAIVPVVGDCLEGLGCRMADGWLWPLTDTRHRPDIRAGRGDGSVDLCLCYATFPRHQKAFGHAQGL